MRISAALALGALLLCPAAARADDNDLVLSRLGQVNSSGTGVVPDNQAYRSLVSELGIVIAPPFNSPADTLGYSGFNFSFDLGFTQINHNASYWCATEQSTGCGAGQEKSTGLIPTVSVFVKKGMWFPVPSFEVGAGA